MIRFPDRDPTGFSISEPDRTVFRKNSTGSDMDIQTSLITAAEVITEPEWTPEEVCYVQAIPLVEFRAFLTR